MEYIDGIVILLVGAVIILSMGVKHFGKQIGIPALVGYVGIGLLLQIEMRPLLTGKVHEIFAFLADLGIIVLLFRVGLESDLVAMIKRLPQASFIWLGNIFISGGLGFLASYYVLEWGLVASLFIATALTATSIVISVSAWQETDALNSPNGALLLDLAEMDDLSGVVFMALLLAIAPLLQSDSAGNTGLVIAELLGLLLLKLTLIGVVCYLIARYIEEPITAFFGRLHGGEEALLVVLGIGMIVAALAGLLGFSVAIGAFFAGLIFSRDPDRVKLDASFGAVHDLFVPFFFVGVGLQLEFSAFADINWFSAVLLVAVAVLGKILGTTLPALPSMNRTDALILGVSMVPRAEIALIIMQQGVLLGAWAVSQEVFANMIVVCTVTTIAVPFVLRPMMKQWPQTQTRFSGP